jgi:hypothetical protein
VSRSRIGVSRVFFFGLLNWVWSYRELDNEGGFKLEKIRAPYVAFVLRTVFLLS